MAIEIDHRQTSWLNNKRRRVFVESEKAKLRRQQLMVSKLIIKENVVSDHHP
jgi:hypothetical protein